MSSYYLFCSSFFALGFLLNYFLFLFDEKPFLYILFYFNFPFLFSSVLSKHEWCEVHEAFLDICSYWQWLQKKLGALVDPWHEGATLGDSKITLIFTCNKQAVVSIPSIALSTGVVHI